MKHAWIRWDHGTYHWVTSHELDLNGQLVEDWNRYLHRIIQAGIQFNNKLDFLVWIHNKKTTEVTRKLAYDLIIEEEDIDSSSWCTRWIRKEHSPLKIKTFMWMCIKRNILTWDVL